MDLRCFHCRVKIPSLNECVNHAYDFHADIDFSILLKCTDTGRYIPKFYHWQPKDHLKVNVTIDPATFQVIYTSTDNECESPNKKVQKLSSTPIKSNVKPDGDNDESQEDTCEEEQHKYDQDEDLKMFIHDMVELLPHIYDYLQKTGRYESWKSLFKGMKTGRLPDDNIAMHLFMDVVDWYGCSVSQSMRYGATIKKFWTVGYKLFREKFIRFMGGYKRVCDKTESHNFDTVNSCVNFVIPDVKILCEEVKKTQMTCDKPGVIQEILELVHPEKSHKITIDGKKINSGFGKIFGDEDLYSHEVPPTLQDRQERLKAELQSFENIAEILEKQKCLGKDKLSLDILKTLDTYSRYSYCSCLSLV